MKLYIEKDKYELVSLWRATDNKLCSSDFSALFILFRYRGKQSCLQPFFDQVTMMPKLFLTLLTQEEFISMLENPKTLIRERTFPLNLVMRRAIYLMTTIETTEAQHISAVSTLFSIQTHLSRKTKETFSLSFVSLSQCLSCLNKVLAKTT